MSDYRASDLGSCLRRRVARHLGYTPMRPPGKFVTIFEGGHEWERAVKDHLASRGFAVYDTLIGYDTHSGADGQEGISVVLKVSDSIRVLGHLDGVIWDQENESVRRVLEVKSMAHDSYEAFVRLGWEMGGLMEKYKWQVSVYMLATGMELQLVGVDKTSDPANPIYHSLYAELPPYSLVDVMTRVLEAEAYMDLPACDAASYPCPFFYLGCDDDAEDSDAVLDALVETAVAQTQIAKLEAAKDKELRQQLMDTMGTRKKVRTDAATVSTQTSTRTVTDWDKMREDGIDVAKYQSKEDGSKYVRLTPRKQRDTGGDGGDTAGDGGDARSDAAQSSDD